MNLPGSLTLVKLKGTKMTKVTMEQLYYQVKELRDLHGPAMRSAVASAMASRDADDAYECRKDDPQEYEAQAARALKLKEEAKEDERRFVTALDRYPFAWDSVLVARKKGY